MKNIFQIVMLSVLLIGLPLGSWYYMNLGYKRAKGLITELKDYGHLPAFSLVGVDGEIIDSSAVNKKTTLVAFVNPNDADQMTFLPTLKKIHKQFDERNDFKILLHLTEDVNIKAFQDQTALEDKEQIFVVKSQSNNADLFQLIDYAYHIPDLNPDRNLGDTLSFKSLKGFNIKKDYHYLVLIDSKGKIRNYYDTNSQKDTDRLVEQIALILPRHEELNPRVRRNREL